MGSERSKLMCGGMLHQHQWVDWRGQISFKRAACRREKVHNWMGGCWWWWWYVGVVFEWISSMWDTGIGSNPIDIDDTDKPFILVTQLTGKGSICSNTIPIQSSASEHIHFDTMILVEVFSTEIPSNQSQFMFILSAIQVVFVSSWTSRINKCKCWIHKKKISNVYNWFVSVTVENYSFIKSNDHSLLFSVWESLNLLIIPCLLYPFRL